MKPIDEEIAAYLSGEMPSDQRAELEQRLANDSEAQKSLAFFQQMDRLYDDRDWELAHRNTGHQKAAQYEAFLKSAQGKSLAENIAFAETGYFQGQRKLILRRFAPWVGGIAATILVCLYFFGPWGNQPDPATLYETHKNWTMLPSLTQRDSSTNLSDAELHFRQKQYEAAATIFEKHLAQQTARPNTQVLVYYGAALLEMGQHEAAIQQFEQLLDSQSLDAPKAYWYLALAYLKTGQPVKAKALLDTLTNNPQGFQYEKAQELIRDLE